MTRRASRVHVFGASGAGTTSLGRALARGLGVAFLDADDYYWRATDPPYLEKVPPTERVDRILHDIGEAQSWVLAGSLCNWGDRLIERFTLAVFLYLDPEIRMARIERRERERFGARIQPEGDMYTAHLGFLAWARSYDTARAPTRSLDLHERWMATLPCPLVRLNAVLPVSSLVSSVRSMLDA